MQLHLHPMSQCKLKYRTITLNKLSVFLFLTVKFARGLGSIDGALLQWECFLKDGIPLQVRPLGANIGCCLCLSSCMLPGTSAGYCYNYKGLSLSQVSYIFTQLTGEHGTNSCTHLVNIL